MNSFPDILLWFYGGLILITTMIVIILDAAFGIFQKSLKRNQQVTRITNLRIDTSAMER